MNKFSNKLKKNCFGPFSAHYSNFGDEKIFPENPALLHTTPHGVLAPCKNLEKINNAIPRKRPNRRKDGQTTFFFNTKRHRIN